MRLYADENFPLPVVAELRRFGNDVLTAFEDGRANLGIADKVLLSRAVALDRSVVTINRRDFKRLHSEAPEHAGIILCTFDIDFPGQAQRIHEMCSGIDLHGRIISVYRPG